MSFIKQNFITSLLSDIDIKRIIEPHIVLKKKGIHYFGKSPFTEENTPSFCVDIRKNRFRDYSSGKSGNAVTFLMEYNSLTFPEAIEEIAKIYGISVEYEKVEIAQKKAEKTKKKDDLRPLLNSTLLHYQNALKQLHNQHPAHKEIAFRGYGQEHVIDWQIGFAPGNKFIYDKISKIKRVNDALELGIISEKESRFYDKYYNRLVYPIHDEYGLLLGFAGRDLSGSKRAAKWINPNQSAIYEKEKIWFGMHRAKTAILNKKEAWIVEGYNDVIAWHINGIENTVAPCGTAITENQIKRLKRFCDSVVLAFDGDKSGKKAIIKYIPILLKHGFTVHVFDLLGCDPDSFTRLYRQTLEKESLTKFTDSFYFKTEGFTYLLEHYIAKLKDSENKDDIILLNKNTKLLCEVISSVPDEATREAFTGWLVNESGIKKPTVNKWLKEYQKGQDPEENKPFQKYVMPDSVKVPFKDVEDCVMRYGLFQAENQIWMLRSSANKSFFTSVSNFNIEVIQHMQDEKQPTKLIRIENVYGERAVFDTPSNTINTLQSFDTIVTNHGRFDFLGDYRDHKKLRSYLIDNMGTGRKITILGWQQEGFFVWNNKVIVPGKSDIEIDKNGVFKHEGTCFYVPSANFLYSSNAFMYPSQKKFKVIQSNVSFKDFCAQVQRVHKGHAITAILYTITCFFRDIIIDEFDNFPILFLYSRAAGTGKDELAKACKSFFGIPQTGLNLESGISTKKAEVREFAQFSNALAHLSEYKLKESDGMIKGLWDNSGYKRGLRESYVANEEIPILAGVILTGNEHPDKEPVISRFLWEEITKREFTVDDDKEFQKLEVIVNNGLSSFTVEILHFREKYKKNFNRAYNKYKEYYKGEIEEIHSRVLHNICIISATYEVLKDHLEFSFTFIEMKEHLIKGVEKQKRKLASTSIVNKWWDCFLAAMRISFLDRIQLRREYKINGTLLYFNFRNVYSKVQRQWYAQYREPAPADTAMKETLKREVSFVEVKRTVRINPSDKNGTSAYVFDLQNTIIKEDIINAIEWQKRELGIPGSVIENNNDTDDIPPPPKEPESKQEDLPF
ncbi:DNA primase [Kordia sp.]|uniref:DNA primase n=1 Tax=Kordia sp. TaxID=1965332 RepID=UPI0025BD12E6|nr:DNA primase [Kordia sp.]MCH2195375.1 DNA primase [Kordia sp.]